MTAYNTTWLDALRVRETASDWHKKGLLSDEKWKAIQERYTSNFYSPNVFVRIGLGFFSLILLFAAIGLVGVFMDLDSEGAFSTLCIFFGVLVLFFLESRVIRYSRHYGSGVDDILLYFGVGSMISGLCMPLPYNTDSLVYYAVAWPFLVAGSIRYIDRLMAMAAYICTFLILFSVVSRFQQLALYLLPFSGMLFSAGVYVFSKQGQTKAAWRHWHHLLATIEILALVTFYLSGNIWIIFTVGLDMFQLERVPMAWFFWAFTFGVPVLYVVQGMLRKDRLLLDIGLGTVAVAVFSFRFFFHVLPWEWAAVIGGGLLLATAYGSIRYLRERPGGVYTHESDGDLTLLQEIEEQLIEQTIASQNPPQPVKKEGFEGGQFGGGGAGENF